MKRFYVKCDTGKEELYIKIKAETEAAAITELHKKYKFEKIIEIRTNAPTVKYAEEKRQPLDRDMYPYIKNSNGKAIIIYT